jgi:hypothetical protein
MAHRMSRPGGNVLPFRGIDFEPPNFKRRALPHGWAMEPTIAKLREIAALSADHLVAEGPVHPDHRLILLCAEALSLIEESDRYADKRHAMHDGQLWTEEKKAQADFMYDQQRGLSTAAASLIKLAAKLKATTPAGIYAKALVIRASLTGAAGLGQSLADDLIACDGLRQTLTWPDGAARQ